MSMYLGAACRVQSTGARCLRECLRFHRRFVPYAAKHYLMNFPPSDGTGEAKPLAPESRGSRSQRAAQKSPFFSLLPTLVNGGHAYNTHNRTGGCKFDYVPPRFLPRVSRLARKVNASCSCLCNSAGLRVMSDGVHARTRTFTRNP